MSRQLAHKTTTTGRTAVAAAAAALALTAGTSKAAIVYWDGNANGANNNVTTGSGLGNGGNWNNSTSASPLLNWWAGSGTVDQSWVNGTDTAVFWGTAGTVTLTDTVTAGGLQFYTTGYTITTGTNSLTFGTGTATIALNTVAAATLTGAVGGTGSVAISSAAGTTGTLYMNGTSTGGWSGSTSIGNGATLALSIGSQALLNTSSISLAGNLTLNNAAAQAGLNRINDSATITSNGGTIRVTNAASATAAYTETTGTVALASGKLNLVATNATTAGGSQLLTLSGLTQSGASAVTFAAAGGLNNTTNQIKVTGKGTTTDGQIIGPWATTGVSATSQTDYAVYSSDVVLPAGIAASAETTWTTAANSYTLNAGTTLTGTRTFAALRYSGAAGTLALGGYNLETTGILNGGTGLLTISGAGLVRQAGTAAANLYVTAGSNGITISSTIADNTGKLTLVKTGTGTLVLSGVNTYTGDTVVLEGALQSAGGGNIYLRGNVVVGSPGGGAQATLGASNMNTYFNTANTSDVTVYSNGLFNFVNTPGGHIRNLTIVGGTATTWYGYVDNTITMTGGTINGTGGVYGSVNNIVTNASSSTATISATFQYRAQNFTVADGAAVIDLNFTGVKNTTSNGLTKSGAGTMALGGANTYTGTTVVSAGTLLLTHSMALQNSPLANGGTGIVFDSSVASHSFQVGGLNGSGDLVLEDNAVTPNAVTLVLNTSTAAVHSYSGSLSGAGNLTKIGTGTQTLSGANSYTGSTLVSAGTLKLAAGATLANTAGITVNSSATFDASAAALTLGSGKTMVNNGAYTGNLTVNGALSGSGSVSGTVSGAGLLSPGNSPGILTVNQVDPSGNLGFAFEFTGTGSPDYSTATSSKNDVLRVTNATPFTSALAATNTVNVYLNVASLDGSDKFNGGFYTDASADFLADITNATYNYYVYGNGSGSTSFNGVNYYTLAEYNSLNASSFQFTVSTVAEAADFGGGTVNGYVTQFAVPEPAMLTLLGLGGLVLLRRRKD